MTKNEGNVDRIIRLVLAVVVFALGFYYQSWLGLIGFVPLITALVGWCPLYAIFGFNTGKAQTNA